MYKKYEDEDGIFFEFQEDLEQFLLRYGVSSQHISDVKVKLLQDSRSFYYDYEKSLEEIKLVPLDKVIGTSRATVGFSVFDNVRMMRQGEREPSRFTRCLSFLKNMTLTELKESYSQLYYPVVMTYYSDEDCYFLTSDGNHRTLTAMLLGADYIKAIVSIAHCNYEKKSKFEMTNEFYKKYNIVDIFQFNGKYEITFKVNGMIYSLYGFDLAKSNESCYEIIDRLSYEIDKYRKQEKQFTKLPKLLRTVISLFPFRSKIIKQYKHMEVLNKTKQKIYLYYF